MDSCGICKLLPEPQFSVHFWQCGKRYFRTQFHASLECCVPRKPRLFRQKIKIRAHISPTVDLRQVSDSTIGALAAAGTLQCLDIGGTHADDASVALIACLCELRSHLHLHNDSPCCTLKMNALWRCTSHRSLRALMPRWIAGCSAACKT